MEEYKTVQRAAEAEIVEKRSRFIAHVLPVQTEEEALSKVEQMRVQYADATHNVFAYNIRQYGAARYSDDGEPGGSSGPPVLDTIKRSGLVDVLIVVTRYFGGTLLGVGGLVRAYSGAAKAGIEAAGVVIMRRCAVYSVSLPYALYGKARYAAESCGAVVDEVSYAADVSLSLHVVLPSRRKLLEELMQATDGQAEIHELPEAFYGL